MPDEPTIEQRMDEWLEQAFGVKLAVRSQLVPKGTVYILDPNVIRFTPGEAEELEIYAADDEDAKAVRRRLARIDGIQ